jgi:hypothetical protein
MKPYLLAPIVIAGLVTATGTATVISAEFQAVRTGEQVAGLFQGQRASIYNVDRNDGGREIVARLDSADRPVGLPTLASIPQTPEPTVDIQMAPIAKSCPASKHVLRFAPRAMHAPRAHSEIPGTELASNYTFHTTPDFPKNSQIFLSGKNGKPFVNMTGLPAICPDAAKVQLVFDAKKFAKDQKAFAKQFKDLRIEAWTLAKMDKLREMGAYQIAFQNSTKAVEAKNGAITINPSEMAAAAQKAEVEALNDQAADKTFIATPNN